MTTYRTNKSTDNLTPELVEALSDLGRFLKVLGPYSRNAVVAGGMVPVIYRHLQAASAVRQRPMTTLDLDIAIPGKIRITGDKSISTLISEGGFDRHLRGSTHPPTTVYQHCRHGKELSNIYVELLTPLEGSDTAKDGSRKIQEEIQTSVTAQYIRYLDLLLIDPISVPCEAVPNLGITDPDIELRIPTPGMYIVQKVLCRASRRANKKDKDLAYIYDVVSLFRKDWKQIGEAILKQSTANRNYQRWIDTALQSLTQLFNSPVSDGPVAVVREISTTAIGVPPSESAVYQVMTAFLKDSNILTNK
jgi:hypothetical protein